MTKHLWASAVLAGLLTTGAALGQDAPPPPPSDFALTIYSTADPATFDPQEAAREQSNDYGQFNMRRIPGYGVVREVRKIDLNQGQNTVKFTDVAAGIDPTTVAFKSLTAPDTTSVLEQNYEFDLVSPEKLLQKYIGKQVIINRKQPPLPDDKTRQPETIEAKLLSFDGNTYVVQTDNKRLPIQLIPNTPDITEIKLFDLDTGLITKPTLVWKVQAEKAGPHDAQVTYQTDGLTWRADYNLVVNKDDTAADLSAWVSILNKSGASYPDSKLKLVAGDVHRLVATEQQPVFRDMGGALGEDAKTGFVEKGFFEYHLYTLGRPTSLTNNSTKQIELFPTRGAIPLSKRYVYNGASPQVLAWNPEERCVDPNFVADSNKKVDLYLRINNTQKNGLGIPLPAGRMRVYKKDEADGANEFVGEDVIQHTPKDEEFSVRLGHAFDLVGDHKQTEFALDQDKHQMTEGFEITLRNHKKEAAEIVVEEILYRWAGWQITACSEKYDRKNSRVIRIPVQVPADGEKKITYTVKYTW